MANIIPGRELKAYTRMPMVDNSIIQFNGLDHQALMNAHPITGQAPGVDTSPIGTSHLENEWGQPNYGYIAGSQTVQGIMAYLRNKRKERDFRDYDRTQQNPLLQIPANPNTTDASQYGDVLLKKGGPSPSKAAEMLRDGTANKKPLTGKQKKYFQCVKHGGCKKEYGGEIEDELERDIFAEPVEQQVEEVQESEQMQQAVAEDPLMAFTPSAARLALEAENYQGSATDVDRFKQGIAKTEGAGYFDPTGIKNEKGEPASSAFGKYQFIEGTRQAVRGRFFPHMSKDEFESKYKTSPEFQERVMDKYSGYLLNKYKDPSIASTAFFLGEGKAYSGKNYHPGGGNKSLGKYLRDAGYAKGGSVYDLLESKGQSGSYASRKKEYGHLFEEGYTGTAEQNTRLYQMIESGQAALPATNVGKELPSTVPGAGRWLGQWGSTPDHVADTTQRNTTITEPWAIPDPNIGALEPASQPAPKGAAQPIPASWDRVRNIVNQARNPIVPGGKPPKAISSSSQPQTPKRVTNQSRNVPISVLPPAEIDPNDIELTDFSGAIPQRNRVKTSDRLESGVIVDKGTNVAHIIKNYKTQRSFPVLTGKGKDTDVNNFTMNTLEEDPSLRATPTGYYQMQEADEFDKKEYENIFSINPIIGPNGQPAPEASSLAMHQTWNAKEREKYYGTDNAWQSYGCVNCKKPDMLDVMKQFPKGDTLRVIDSRKGLPVFKEGGSYFMTNEQIKELKRQGYELE